MEEINDEVIVENLDFSSSEINAFIERVEAREISLSPSSLRAFCRSPRHFIAYKLGKFKPSPAMIFGSLVDCLITQPGEFHKHFYFPPEGAKLTSKEGAAAWLSLWGVQCPVNFGEAKALALEMMEREQRSKITQALYNEAEKIVAKMRRNQPFYNTLNEADQFQSKVTFQFEGWDILGYADMARTGEWVADLKMAPDTGENKIRFKIRDELLLQQLAIYAHGLGVTEARLLFFDRTQHFRAVRIGNADLTHWMKYVGNVIDKFEDCVFNGNWEQSHDFWSPNWDGFFDL
jgi:hypothetical protein